MLIILRVLPNGSRDFQQVTLQNMSCGKRLNWRSQIIAGGNIASETIFPLLAMLTITLVGSGMRFKLHHMLKIQSLSFYQTTDFTLEI